MELQPFWFPFLNAYMKMYVCLWLGREQHHPDGEYARVFITRETDFSSITFSYHIPSRLTRKWMFYVIQITNKSINYADMQIRVCTIHFDLNAEKKAGTFPLCAMYEW
jgi:hypothetical protein